MLKKLRECWRQALIPYRPSIGGWQWYKGQWLEQRIGKGFTHGSIR